GKNSDKNRDQGRSLDSVDNPRHEIRVHPCSLAEHAHQHSDRGGDGRAYEQRGDGGPEGHPARQGGGDKERRGSYDPSDKNANGREQAALLFLRYRLERVVHEPLLKGDRVLHSNLLWRPTPAWCRRKFVVERKRGDEGAHSWLLSKICAKPVTSSQSTAF